MKHIKYGIKKNARKALTKATSIPNIRYEVAFVSGVVFYLFSFHHALNSGNNVGGIKSVFFH
jgi:hypothetical protein